MLVKFRFVVDRAQFRRQWLDAEFFADLTQHRLLDRFVRLPPAAGQLPTAPTIAVADEQDPVVSIEDHGRGPQVRPPTDELVVKAAEGGDQQATDWQRSVLHPLMIGFGRIVAWEHLTTRRLSYILRIHTEYG